MISKLNRIKSKQRGFTLLEALIAFMIISIGMLGIASLQLLSLKAGKTAELRTLATFKAEEILERIRSNPEALDPAKSANGYDSGLNDWGTSMGCNVTKSCSRAEMALDDIFQWKQDLLTSMNTTAKASVATIPSTPGVQPYDSVTVTINWQERNQESQTMDNMSYSVTAYICNNTKC
ncbi:MAG: type IV pilus modification protein PilV [Gammaproteobacteria bacterium]|nr:type IV pilus modification protein PilV [Gammaproteobacteria bacterium]